MDVFDGIRTSWQRFVRRLGAGGRRSVPVWHHPDYRLPIASMGQRHGLEPRRADFALWTLEDEGWIGPGERREPTRIPYAHLARVHTSDYLRSLSDPAELARIFVAEAREVDPDEVMTTVRLAAGGTLAAAREVLDRGGPALNLLGGFHHASPGKGGGLCPVNDLAVAIAVLRADGFSGRVAVLDLDAHPPDGTADCLVDDDATWIGSLSGSDWGPLPSVDETVLPEGTGDEAYLDALAALLGRMPEAELALVVAGGDVLAGDRFGLLGMSLDGVRRRDRAVLDALGDVPSVWVPGGGYTKAAWIALATTGAVLTGAEATAIDPGHDPLQRRYRRIARQLDRERLAGHDEPWFTEADLGLAPVASTTTRLLGFYTAEGLEYALHEYGVFEQLARLGYSDFRATVDRADIGDRGRFYARADGEEHLVGEMVVERVHLDGHDLLFVHWLTLRNPRAGFGPNRERLPGQELPGLGLAREIVELLEMAARRLGLDGVAFRPSYFHTAVPSHDTHVFLNPARQGRWEALLRDLGDRPPAALSQALDEGRVEMNGLPYHWEADVMACFFDSPPRRDDEIEVERDRVRFALRAVPSPSPEEE